MRYVITLLLVIATSNSVIANDVIVVERRPLVRLTFYPIIISAKVAKTHRNNVLTFNSKDVIKTSTITTTKTKYSATQKVPTIIQLAPITPIPMAPLPVKSGCPNCPKR